MASEQFYIDNTTVTGSSATTSDDLSLKDGTKYEILNKSSSKLYLIEMSDDDGAPDWRDTETFRKSKPVLPWRTAEVTPRSDTTIHFSYLSVSGVVGEFTITEV